MSETQLGFAQSDGGNSTFNIIKYTSGAFVSFQAFAFSRNISKRGHLKNLMPNLLKKITPYVSMRDLILMIIGDVSLEPIP